MKDLKTYINQLRRDFASQVLDERNVGKDPFSLFEQWMTEAVKAEVKEPNAMVLSTVSAEAKPSSRIVLLRDFSSEGFVFFTNYKSAKGSDLNKNPHATLLFFWPELERQIRITGMIKKTSEQVSDEYFNSRPRESRIGAWTSEQSSRISSRKELEDRYVALEKEFEGKEVPRPPHWGGYLLGPDVFEYWQGRPSRLHDRLLFEKNDGHWDVVRLAP